MTDTTFTINEPATVFHPGPHRLARTPEGWQDEQHSRRLWGAYGSLAYDRNQRCAGTFR